MTLQQIRYIQEISKYGTINKAAQNLFIAQSYLSNTLKDLEKELGIEIFSRTSKGVELTTEGREFLNYAKLLLEQEEKILGIYSKNKQTSVFKFSLSTQRYPFVIKAFFEIFNEFDPKKYDIHIREEHMHCVIDSVFNNKSEIGIIFLSNSNSNFIKKYINSKNIEFNEILTVKPRVFFRKNHPMADKSSVTLEDMKVYPFASFESSNGVSHYFCEEVMLENLPESQKFFYVIDRATMVNVLSNTNAFSIGTGVISNDYTGFDLISKPIENTPEKIQLGWIKLAEKELSAFEKSFIEKIKEVIETED